MQTTDMDVDQDTPGSYGGLWEKKKKRTR